MIQQFKNTMQIVVDDTVYINVKQIHYDSNEHCLIVQLIPPTKSDPKEIRINSNCEISAPEWATSTINLSTANSTHSINHYNTRMGTIYVDFGKKTLSIYEVLKPYVNDKTFDYTFKFEDLIKISCTRTNTTVDSSRQLRKHYLSINTSFSSYYYVN